MLLFHPSITMLSLIAGCFILLGIFYPFIADRLGLDEGKPEQRMLAILLGLGLFALLLIFQVAERSMLG